MFVDIPRAKMLQARRCSRKNNRKSDFCEGNIIVSARLTWDSDVVHPKTPTVPLHHRSHVSAISHHKLGNFFSGSSLAVKCAADVPRSFARSRSEEHTSELQSLMRISYAVFFLKKTNRTTNTN